MRARCAAVSFAIALFAAPFLPAMAQSGGLTIRVIDPGGAPLPGAIVELHSAQRLVADAAAQTDAEGRVDFPVLRPGGGYSVKITFPGYATRTLADLRVRAEVREPHEVRMQVSVEETVEVRAGRSIVDLDETARSSRFGDEFLADLPVQGRQYQNVLRLAPGVLDADEDGNPNVHGARARDFKTVVNGVSNVDPLTGYFMSNVNPDSIEELEVIPTGAGAEFGRAQGGFARVIQKQGSNDFEGVFNLLLASDILDAEPDTEAAPEYTTIQPSIQVSGPIARDRLWYRFSLEAIRREDPVDRVQSVEVTTQRQTLQSYQLTWQASPRNKLALQYQSDPKTLTNVNMSSRVPPEASQQLELGGPTASLTWTAAQSPRVLVESLVAWQEKHSNVVPSAPGVENECVENTSLPVLNRAQCFKTNNNTLSGSYPTSSHDRSQRLTVATHADMYAGRFWGGEHRFKIGFTAENERYYRTREQRPDFDFTIYKGLGPTFGIASYRIPFPDLTSARVTGMNWGVYLEDQYRPASNLTLTLGARYDHEQLDSLGLSPMNPEAEALAFQAARAQGTIPTDQLPGRIFTAYQDLTAFQTYIADVLDVDPSDAPLPNIMRQSGNWLHRRGTSEVHLRNGNVAPRFAVAWDPTSNGKTKLTASAGRYYDKIFLGIPLIELEPVTTTLNFYAVSEPEPVGGTYILHFFIYERPLGDGSPITTRVVDRNLRTPYLDEISAGFEREISAETAVRVSWIHRNFEDQLQDTDINHGVLNLGAPAYYTLNPVWGQILLVGNFNATRYEAYVVELIRRLYRGWQLDGSYTWSKAEGAAEDFNQLLGDDPRSAEDEQGLLSYDQRHVVKISATAHRSSGWRLGGTMQYESGLPYSTEAPGVLRSLLPPGYPGAPTSVPTVLYPSGRRNDNRNTSFWTFNARVQREWTARSVTYGISADVFNLIDDGTTRTLDITGGVPNVVGRAGRRLQLGFRAAF